MPKSTSPPPGPGAFAPQALSFNAANAIVGRFVGHVAVAVVLTLTGCSSLQPVAEFGKNASAIAGYPDVAADYPAGLERKHLYGQTDPSVSDASIAIRKRDARRLRDAQEILEAYARALGALASDDLIDYDKQVDALNKSLVSVKFATSAQTEGYSKIAKFGLRLGTDIYRRNKIGELITTYNPYVQKATGNLITIVEKGYLTGLAGEKILLQKYVAGPAAKSTQETEGLPEIINIVSAQQTEMLEKKEQNAQALAKGMRVFAKGHQKLANNIGKVSFTETLSVARDYAGQLRDILKSFRT